MMFALLYCYMGLRGTGVRSSYSWFGLVLISMIKTMAQIKWHRMLDDFGWLLLNNGAQSVIFGLIYRTTTDRLPISWHFVSTNSLKMSARIHSIIKLIKNARNTQQQKMNINWFYKLLISINSTIKNMKGIKKNIICVTFVSVLQCEHKYHYYCFSVII